MLQTPSCERIDTLFCSPQWMVRTLTQQTSAASATLTKLPLNTPTADHIYNMDDTPDSLDEFQSSTDTDLLHEIYELLQISIPIALGYISEWIPTYVSNMFLGHLPNAHLLLAGVGLARVFSNTTALSIVWGLLSGLYTLLPQAVGNQKVHLLSLYTQRAFCVSIICSIPLIALQFFISDILLAIGEPSIISQIMTVSCRYLIIHIYASVVLTILRRIAQNLQYTNEIFVICMICAFLSYPFNYLLIHIMRMNYVGCVLSIGLNTLLNVILMIWMLVYYGHANLFKWNRMSKIFRRKPIIGYLKMSIPGIFTNSFEWWYYEITILFAGFITNNTSIALSSSVILHNVFMMIELIGAGIARGLSIQIGQCVGANDQSKAKTVMKAGIIVSLSMSCMTMAILFILKPHIVILFTNDERVIRITTDVMQIAVLGTFFIITNHSLSGVYHAIGKQKVSAWIIFISYFGIGVPVLVVVLFGLGLKTSLFYGTMLIFGMLCAGNVIATLLMQQYLSCFINWNSVISDAQSRLQETITKTANTMGNYGSCVN